jgi:hypothetical protein
VFSLRQPRYIQAFRTRFVLFVLQNSVSLSAVKLAHELGVVISYPIRRSSPTPCARTEASFQRYGIRLPPRV